MSKHELKTDPAVFQDVLDGKKTYELRLNDRGFCVGDELLLRETTHTGAEIRAGAPLEYTGRETTKTVAHMLTGPIYGLAAGWSILSFEQQRTVESDTALREWGARLLDWTFSKGMGGTLLLDTAKQLRSGDWKP